MKLTNSSNLFPSYLMGGFECSYSLTKDRTRLDLLSSTKHDVYCQEDYQLLKELNIQTVREGLKWVEIDKGNNEYDFSRFEKMMQIAKEEGIKQIWDLNHYDFPERLDPFTNAFITQFAEYGKRVIETIRRYQTVVLFLSLFFHIRQIG